jgi:arsenite methyltransferase
MATKEDIREEVRRHYSQFALALRAKDARDENRESCCGPKASSDCYDRTSLGELPDEIARASAGCGNPIAVAELCEGETVLDLGSGGGLDVLLSARRVGPSGQAIGLDMNDEMLALARENAARAGAENISFLKGEIEAIPLPDESVNVVISNCVVNLSTDKARVFAEIARVLKRGGRIGVTDIVANDALSPEQRAERGSFAGCIAGALSFSEYEAGLASAGLEQIEIEPAHRVGAGFYSAIIRARKPSGAF